MNLCQRKKTKGEERENRGGNCEERELAPLLISTARIENKQCISRSYIKSNVKIGRSGFKNEI